MLHHAIYVLLFAFVVLGVAKVTPGVRVRDYGTAVGVAIVYSVLSVFFYAGLTGLIAKALGVLTLGLLFLVFNAFLLWLTDKLVNGLKIESKGSLMVATLGLTIGGWVIRHFVY